MSWIGEQFASITEKITDFTKEVLTENKEEFPIGENGPGGSPMLPNTPESFSVLLEQRDSTIEKLLKEKESLEKSVEELDEQHQEAIDEILLLKQDLLLENKKLKQKLKDIEDPKELLSTNAISASHVFDYLRSIDFNSGVLIEDCKSEFEPLNNINSSIECNSTTKFNLLGIIFSLKEYSGREQIEELIKSLEAFKLPLDSWIRENEVQDTSLEIHCDLRKINACIDYLKSLCNHDESIFPFIRELFSFLEFVCLNYIQPETKNTGNFKTDKNIDTVENYAIVHSPLVEKCALHHAIDKCDAVVQTENVDGDSIAVGPSYLDIDVQTTDLDCKGGCLDCENISFNLKLITKLQHELDKCRQEIQDLENETFNLKSKLKSECHIFHSKSIQTEKRYVCDCDTLRSEVLAQSSKVTELQYHVKEKEKEFVLEMENEASRLKEVMDELKLKKGLIEDKEKFICDKNNEILSLNNIIDKLKKELKEIKKNECNKYSNEMQYDNSKETDGYKTFPENDSFQTNKESNKCMTSPLMNSFDFKPSSCLENVVLKLREALKNAELEKGRLMCVLNEKTQECSTLKADVHRLTTIVSSEKQALLKLQQDNYVLKKVQEDSLDPELTKEALQNLSRIIRDKDFEVESLKQRNSSLSSLVQQSCSSAEHLQSLMEERENLAKQLNLYKSECEKFANAFNSKVQECQLYFAEVQRLKSLLSCQSEQLDVLQQQHHSVAQQYEEKQKSLINTQNEMIALKQRVTDLEQQQIDIKGKYTQLLDKMNSDAMIQITKDELNCKLSELENLKISLKDKESLIREKDGLIHELSQELKKHKAEFELQEAVITGLKKENSIFLSKLEDYKVCQQELQDGKDNINQRLNDKQSELVLQKEMNERLSMTLKEREFAVQSMEKKISSLSQLIQGSTVSTSPSHTSDIDQILTESKMMFSKAEQFQRERDESLLSLSQCQQENQELKNEFQNRKSKEDHLRNELDRLRQHLLQIEENYTNEALKAEEREKDLRTKLSVLENSTRVSNSAVLDASHQADVQVASLQEQVAMLANQRDKALAQVSVLDDKVQHYATSLNNLQLVLEQMQKGNDQKMVEMERRFQVQFGKEKEKSKNLEMQLKVKQMQLEESSQAIEAASRLSEQLDCKEELITMLKCELSKTENMVKMTAAEVETVRSSSEGKVDRLVIKSLVLGYFSTPSGQKSEVVRLLARVLDFSQDEMAKAGIVVCRTSKPTVQRGLLSSLFGKLPSLTSSNIPSKNEQRPSEKSLASLFVQFLESESQPLNPLPLPAEKMAREQTSKAAHSQKKQQTSANSPLLLNINTSFPTFSPVPVSDYGSPAPSILEEVLK